MRAELFTKWLVYLTALACLPAASYAQQTSGVEVDVSASGTSRLKIALPAAVRAGELVDNQGITESIEQTLYRDLGLAGFFELVPADRLLHDARAEGMTPRFSDYFNVGAQAVIKVSYEIKKASPGKSSVVVDLQLFSVATEQRVALEAPFDKPKILAVSSVDIRRYTTLFADEVIRHFTGSKGVFSSRLAVVKRSKRGKEIYMLSADGLEEVRLTRKGGLNLLPSLRANRLYFTSFRAGRPDLYELINGKVKPIASYKGLNTGAALSPKGDALAITLSKDGNPEIYLLNPDTGAVIKKLTNSWGIDTSPSWSPDGSKIAFVSDRHGSPQIWTMNADGTQAKRLTFQGDYNQTPAWSPKGDHIAFTARDERNVFDIFSVRVSDSMITRLTQNQGNNEEPTWSPDGRYLAFTSTRSGRSELYLSNPDGRFQRKLSTREGVYLTPSWGR
jgi:TolB protein